MVTTEYIGEEKEINFARTLISQEVEIKAKTLCYYESDAPADVSVESTESTIATNWQGETPDFKLLVYPFPRLADAALGATVTATPFGKLSAASWKSIYYYYKIITFTDGTYACLKSMVLVPMPYDYIVEVTGNVSGVSNTYTVYMSASGTPRRVDLRRFDASGANLVINIRFIDYQYTGMLTFITSDAGNYSICTSLEPLEIQFDVYNEFDKMSAPAFAVSVSDDTIRGTIIQLSQYRFLGYDAERIGMELNQYLNLIAKALHFRDSKGYATITTELSSQSKVKSLSGNIVAILSAMYTGLTAFDITIPEHFRQWIETGILVGQDALIAAAIIAATDDIVIEISL
jgi:hypothetical protein